MDKEDKIHQVMDPAQIKIQTEKKKNRMTQIETKTQKNKTQMQSCGHQFAKKRQREKTSQKDVEIRIVRAENIN